MNALYKINNSTQLREKTEESLHNAKYLLGGDAC